MMETSLFNRRPLVWFFFFVHAILAAGRITPNGKSSQKEQFPVPLQRQKEIFKAANKIPNNIEYVGCGYDMYGVNDIDENSGFSLNNYRGPIIDDYHVEEDSMEKKLHQMGLWISNEFLCDISHELTAVDNQQKLKSMVNSQTKHDSPGVFSSTYVDTKKKNHVLNTLQRFREVIVKMYKCTVYSAGLISNNNRDNMKRFNAILSKLKEGCKSQFAEGTCTPEKYSNNMADEGCIDCVAPWMRFFDDFGTHITSRVTMGGVIRKFSHNRKKEANRNESVVTVSTTDSYSWFGLSHSTDESTDKSDFSDERKNGDDDILQYTVGPEPRDASLPPEAFEDWVQRVAYNPVPISTEFTSLHEFMPDEDTKKMYKEALMYYAKIKGVSYSEENITTQRSKSFLMNLMKEAIVVTKNGPQEVKNDVCPGKSKILFGFGLNLNEEKQILELKQCLPGLNACLLDYNPDIFSTFIVAYCGENGDNEIQQKIIKGSPIKDTYDEVKCPKHFVVGLGIIVKFGNPMVIESCPKGNKTCGYSNLGLSGMIWTVCFPKNTFGLNLYDTHAALNPKEGTTKCQNKGYRVLNGFSFKNSKKQYWNWYVRVEACQASSTSCRPTVRPGDSIATHIVCAH